MSTKYLGETFDFHGGGRDLIFPHHENELAQSCALGGDFVRYWMHNGLLTLDGQKMAKSTGHFFAVKEVLSEFDADVVRYYLLRGHFRNQMEYSRERLEEAAAAYERMRRALILLDELVGDPDLGSAIADGVTTPEGIRLEDAAEKAGRGFIEGLCDDFNAEAAMGALFELVRLVNPLLSGKPATGIDREPVRAVRDCLRDNLGVLGLFERVSADASSIPQSVLDLAGQRDAARAERDFARADELRDEILAAGFRIEDGPDGTRVRQS
jgi:cysteinyl-tRNA synthetase